MKKKWVVVFIIVGFVTGCANMKKTEIGTLVGALAGAAIGSKVDGTRGAVIGAVVAGYIGNKIGSHLDEQDRLKLAELELKSLETSKEESFVTTKSNAKVTLTPQELKVEPKREFVLSNSLKQHPLMQIEPISINAFVDTPIYSDLNEKSKPRMIIQKGALLTVPAEIQNKDWVVIGDNDLGLGYVPKRFLKPEIIAEQKKKAPKVNPKAKESTVVANTEKTEKNKQPLIVSNQEYQNEIETLNKKVKSAELTKANTKETNNKGEFRVVNLAQECKVVVRKIDTGNESDSFSENVKYCKEPPKGWKTQTI